MLLFLHIVSSALLLVAAVPPFAHLSFLDAKGLDSFIEQHRRLVAVLVVDDCGACKTITPALDQAEANCKSKGLQTAIVVVNASTFKEPLQTAGYPTVFYYVQGHKTKTYVGLRDWLKDPRETLDWIKKRELATVDVNEKTGLHYKRARAPAMTKGYVYLVAVVKKNSVRHKAALAATEELANYDAFNARLIVRLLDKNDDPKKDARLTLYRAFFPEMPSADEEDVTYHGTWSAGGIRDFVIKYAFPLVGESFNPKTYGQFALDEMGWGATVIAIMDKNEDDQYRAVAPVLLSLAREHTTWKFTIVNFTDLSSQDQKMIGIDKYSYPAINVLRGKFKFSLEDVDAMQDRDEVSLFLENITKGNLRPAYKSEPRPEGSSNVDVHGATILTGKTFHKVALNPKQDVLVFFTSSMSCSRCQQLAQIWGQIVEQLNKTGVHSATMDAMLNDCEEEVEDFPKLALYPAVPSKKKMKKRQVYKGPYDVESVSEFAIENSIRRAGSKAEL